MLNRTESENYAFLASVLGIEKYLEDRNKPCALVKMGPNLFYGHLIIAWEKDFLYADLFNY